MLCKGWALVLCVVWLPAGTDALTLPQVPDLAVAQPKDIPRPLAWLHIPKCGTSFANVLYNHPAICPNMPAGTYMHSGEQWTAFTKKHSLDVACPGSFVRNFRGDHYGLGLEWWFLGGGNHTFGFFRQPEQRVISGYVDKLKDYPTKGYHGVTLPEYARAMEGCATRMLTRGAMPCGQLLGTPSAAELELAVARVQEMAFVGLTDQWDLSICLFYAMYGGNCTDVAFLNTRPGRGRTAEGEYNASKYLGSWRDRFDGRVYKKAQEVFWQRVEQYGVTRSTCERICENATETRPFALHEKGLAMRLHATFEPEYDWAGRASYIED